MKFRVTVTTVKEFETDISDYDDCKTPEEALKLEQASAEDDPFLITEGGNTTVVVELIEP